MDISGDKYDLRVGHTTNPKVGYLDLTFQINSKAKETQKNNYKISVIAEKGE